MQKTKPGPDLIGSPEGNALATEVTPEEKKLLARPRAPASGELEERSGRVIHRDFLVNRLNFINFQEQSIQIHFSHRQSTRRICLTASPQPCIGPELECRWAEAPDSALPLENYRLDYLLVPYGEKFIKSVPEIIEISAAGCRLRLPAAGREVGQRRVERQHCRGISVNLVQNSSVYSGALFDFSATSFRVELTAEPPLNFEWIDPQQAVQVILSAGGRALFSGECRILRTTPGRNRRSYVLEPLKSEIQRYRKAEFRSERQTLRPEPNIIFHHPLSQKRFHLKVVDLSGSGFSVEEDEHTAGLMPGLILPDAELHFAGVFKMTCTVQVVFRKLRDVKEGRDRVLCGLALIDAPAEEHVKLLGMLQQLKNKNAYICNDLDLNALWDFFFDTGFIYPEKYALLAEKKNEIKSTYAKLYTHSPDIARHFVYQDNGVILGHMAAIRYWDNAWLIHHHAARKSALNRAGLIVLDQIGSFGHDTFRIRRMHMDYLVCYYRPQNRFPERIFGGVARHINDPKGCSVDLFGYLKRSTSGLSAQALPQGWELCPADAMDMEDLGGFYESVSGGLMLGALDLTASGYKEEELCAEFHRKGFQRERRLFALKRTGALKAVLVVNISDIGLNLSDLTHCINALVLDPDSLPPEILFTSLSLAERASGQSCLPALIFPMSYVEKNAIALDKAYNLWIFHMHTQSQVYFKYISRLLRHKQPRS